MARLFARFLAVLSAVLLGAAYARLDPVSDFFSGAAWGAAGFLVLLGGGWVLGSWRGWNWLPTLVFSVFLLAAGLGFLFAANRFLLFIGAAAALAAWDLEDLAQRMQRAGRVDNKILLELQHLVRLASTLALAFGLAALTFWLPVRLGPLAAAGLGLLAVFALARGIAVLRK